MALTLVTGPANAGKARAILRRVMAQAQRGREPRLVVPTHADVASYRRELARDGCVLGVTTETFGSLLREIAHRAGVPGPVVGRYARERVAAAVCERAATGALAPLARSPELARRLVALAAELRAERIGPARLRAALAAWGGGGRGGYAEAIGALYAGYCDALERLGMQDAESQATAALDALRLQPARWRDTPVLFYGFDDLTGIELDAIETLATVVDAPIAFSLAYEPGRAAFAGRATTFALLQPLAGEHEELPPRSEHYSSPALHHLERELLQPDPATADAGDAVRLIEGSEPRAELDLVAHEVARLIAAGWAPEEIAIVCRHPERRAALLESALAAVGVPFALRRSIPFPSTAIGAALCGLLRCATGRGTLEDLLRWLRAPGVVRRVDWVDDLEASCRRAGIADAATARALWAEDHWSLDTISRLADATAAGGERLLQVVERTLITLFDEPVRGSAPVLTADTELREAQAFVAARSMLGELRGLPVDLLPDLDALHDALAALRVTIPARAGVAVLDPLSLRARRVRALFLCDLVDGSFPAPAHEEAFLPDAARAALAAASGLGLPLHGIEEAERYLLYAAASRPSELLVLSRHLADEVGDPVAPSPFLEALCAPFGGRERLPLVRDEHAAPPRPVAPASPAPLRLIDPEAVSEVAQRAWSASGLSRAIACPVAWFVEHMLRPRELDGTPSPLSLGSVRHAVLDATLARLFAQTGSGRVTTETLQPARTILREELDARAEDGLLPVAPELRAATRRRMEYELDRYLAHVAGQDWPLEPRHLELAFGMDEDDEEPTLPGVDIGEGVILRGRIDRIDVSRHGAALVVDYKARHVEIPGDWLATGTVQVALYMTVAERLLDLDVAGGVYQPLAGRDLRARGVVAAEADLGLRCVNGDERPAAAITALRGELTELSIRAVDRARTGLLQPSPQTCTRNGGCAYPSLCRCVS